MAFDDESLATQTQDVVAIIEPASQTGARGDIVTIVTSALVDDEIVQLTERREVREDGGQFRLRLRVPARGTGLDSGLPWSAVVLLPARRPNEFAVQIDDLTQGDMPGRVLTEDDPRPIVVWQGIQDPVLDVLWQYIRLN